MPPVADAETSARITGCILAGGRATRMGGRDKGLVELAGRPMVEHILRTLRPQVRAIVINANRNQTQYAGYGYPVVGDDWPDYRGPLAGIAAGMARAETEWLMALPCDGPLVPADLAERLLETAEQEAAEVAVAHDGERIQPTFALIRTALLPSLRDYLGEGERKIDRWYGRQRLAEADFSDCTDTFINVNTPEQREELTRRLGHQSDCNHDGTRT